MAKLLGMPSQAVIDGYKGKIDFYLWHPTCDPENRGDGIPVARKWPRSPGHLRAPAVMAQWPIFTEAARGWSKLSKDEQDAYRAMAAHSGMSGRDLFTRSYIKGLLPYPTG